MKRRMVAILLAVLTISFVCGITGCGSKKDVSNTNPTVSEEKAEQEELDKIRKALQDDDDLIPRDEDDSADPEDYENDEEISVEDEEPSEEFIKWGIVRKQYQQIESKAASAVGKLEVVDGDFVMKEVESIYSKVDYLKVGIDEEIDEYARDAYLAACKLEYLGVKGEDVSDSVPIKLGSTAKEMIELCYGEGDGNFKKLQKKVKAYIEMMYEFDQDDWDEFKSHF